MKAQTSSWPPPVRTLHSQVFMSRRLGGNFWPGIAAALLVRVTEVGCNWCEDSPSANCVESSCSMAHGGGNRGSFFEAIFGFGFCFPSFLSVLKLTPKSVSKIETIFGFRFLFAGLVPWHPVRCTRRPIFLLRRYIQFLPSHTSKQNWLDFPSQLNHRQASICMLLRCSKNTGGVLELVRNFRDVLRSWLWRRNPVQWLWSYECIGCWHLLFWEFVLRGLRNLAPKILKLVSGQVAVIFTFQWHVGRLLEVLAGCFWVWYFPAGPAVADALVCLSFGAARLPAPGLFEFCLRWLVAAWHPSRIGNDCVWVFAWCHSSCHLQIRVIHDDLNVLSLRLSAEWSDD